MARRAHRRAPDGVTAATADTITLGLGLGCAIDLGSCALNLGSCAIGLGSCAIGLGSCAIGPSSCVTDITGSTTTDAVTAHATSGTSSAARTARR